jgi:hypothetical protein
MVAPYAIMKALTNFDNGQSTRSQRAWIMVWITFTQVLGPFGFGAYNYYSRVSSNPVRAPLATIFLTLVYSVGSIGGFVVVGKMMLDDLVCVTI